MNKNFVISFLVALLIFIIWQKPAYYGDNQIVIRDTLYKDTTITKWKKGKDITYKVVDIVHDSLFNTIHDTQYIVKDYNEVKVYNDTLKLDSLQYVSVVDTITRNQILGRSYQAKLVEKTIKETIVKDRKNAIYIGGNYDFRRFGLGVQYQNNKNLFGISLHTDKSIQISYHVRLH